MKQRNKYDFLYIFPNFRPIVYSSFVNNLLNNADLTLNSLFIALQVRNHPEIIPQLIIRLKDYLSAHPDINHYKGKLFLATVRLG